MNLNFRQINPNIKSLYAFLKKYDIENFFLTKDFEIALMELNLDQHWNEIEEFQVNLNNTINGLYSQIKHLLKSRSLLKVSLTLRMMLFLLQNRKF